MNKELFNKFKIIIIGMLILGFAVTKIIDVIKTENLEDDIIFYDLTEEESEQEDEVQEEQDKSDETVKDNKININTASSEELQTLTRIGPALAQRIIDYRTQYGEFKTIEEIKEVNGIGDATFEKIKDSIKVK